MFGKLDEVVKRHEELTHLLGTVEVASDTKKMIEYNKALNEITPLVEKYSEYKSLVDDLEFIKENIKSELLQLQLQPLLYQVLENQIFQKSKGNQSLD